jgi:polysaccharide biosynthesis protein PslG
LRHRLLSPLLLALTLLAGLPPAAVQGQPLSTSEFGINSHIASRYGNYDVMDWPADVIASSGAGWVREDFHWFWIEPKRGRFQWDYYDRMVDLFASRGVNMIGVLGHPPGWATAEPGDGDSEPSFYAPDPKAFAEFAYQVVTRYRYRIVHWEIWNEPDNPQFWKPQPDPFAYAQLLSTVSPVISAAAPETNILLGGINPFEISFLRTIAEVGAWWTFDILNIHPYVDPGTPESGGEIGVAAIANLQQVTNWAGGKPIWVTEYGWSARPSDRDPAGSITEEDQANYMVRAAVLLRAAGVERVLWYSIKDEVHNGYGVLRFGRNYDDYSEPRPSYTAFVALNRNLAGATFERRLDEVRLLSGERVYALRFRRGGAAIDVLWALTPSVVDLPSPGADARVVNRSGNAWGVSAESGALRLYPDASPIYVVHSPTP